MLLILRVFLLLVAALPAFASDGVIELNDASALAGGVAGGDTPGYPIDLGSERGSYILTGDLNPGFGQALVNDAGSAGGIEVDLNGFRILGAVTLLGEGNSIKNGSINGLSGSVSCLTLGDSGRAKDLFISDCFRCLSSGQNSMLTRNVIDGCPNSGIVMGSGSLVTHNVIRNANPSILPLGGGSPFFVCRDCLIRENVCDTAICAEAARERRRFYLTAQKFDGSNASQSCAAGFHMASIYELKDYSMEYVFVPLVTVANDDFGSGPPTGIVTRGWIRTSSQNSPVENCSGYSTTAGQFAYNRSSVGRYTPKFSWEWA